MIAEKSKTLGMILIGVCLGAAGQAYLFSSPHVASAQEERSAPNLSDEIEAIKGKLPSQSHTMQDVSYHFSNLWFAGQLENWNLAQFYFDETVSHLHWAVRVIPIRKDNAGADINLGEILTAFENGPLKELNNAIGTNNQDQFDKAYETSLAGCYACHKAADKPYLRLQIPEQSESSLINFDPSATGP